MTRYTGTVVHGNGRGKGLGFPTANLSLTDLAPADGVYSAWVRLGAGEWRGATISVGNNPTFRNVRERRMECHLHDLNEDVYGETIEVEIVAYLREMEVFSGERELIDQTALDVEASRALLARAADRIPTALPR